jgi:hypothetical protein
LRIACLGGSGEPCNDLGFRERPLREAPDVLCQQAFALGVRHVVLQQPEQREAVATRRRAGIFEQGECRALFVGRPSQTR